MLIVPSCQIVLRMPKTGLYIFRSHEEMNVAVLGRLWSAEFLVMTLKIVTRLDQWKHPPQQKHKQK